MATVQENALKLLQCFYDRTRNRNTRMRIQDAASQASVYLPDAEGAARYLAEKGLIEVHWLLAAAAISPAMITAQGIDQIETAQRAPDAPLRYFPSVTYNMINLHHVENAAIQQGTTQSTQTQTAKYNARQTADFAKLADLLEAHLQRLHLEEAAQRKVLAQVETIRAQLQDEPDPVILHQVGKTLRNVTEGAIAGLIAAGAQPAVWEFVHTTINKLANM